MDTIINSSSEAWGPEASLDAAVSSKRTYLLFGLGFCGLLAIWHYLTPSQHGQVKEPPAVSPSIPLIGHFLGFYQQGIQYLETLRRKTPWPAFTIKLFSIKTYVVTTPALSHVALRSKSLSLEPLSATVATRMLGLSKAADRHFGIDERGEFVGSPTLGERRVEFSKLLGSGSTLSEPSQVASNAVADAVNKFDSNWESHDLFMWLRDVITVGTVAGLYGPKNPVALDPTLIEDIWTFDENQLRLSWGIFPKLVAPAGVRAVNRISAAFENYIHSGNDKLGSAAVQTTIAALKRLGLSDNDYSRLEVFNISVATVNTVPTAVSMISAILADPKLLFALRDEVQAIAATTTPPTKKHAQLDMAAAQTACPLLIACYQEALRIGSLPTCNRAVLEDTTLVDPDTGVAVAMQKGHRVSIPTFMLHGRDQIWGGDAQKFDPWRFMPGGSAADAKGRAREQGFVPYGGGVHLCPGRHLAKAEILASGALMVMALDFVVGGEMAGASAAEVRAKESKSGAKKPKAAERMVRIRRREGWEDVVWSVKA
ncbi:cytochrome P450 [Bombardia bombarda]|uniref:Cytochrome P450 n=1 Tax=Bombardia bombarda TaxID=252184 RepID=A0AA39XKN4_9PEZI|nr:cytochrome P450 [Bombardia bombarda]